LVIQRVEHATFHDVSELPGSDRGAAGHGSSGGFTHPDPTSGGS
jgi:dUTP pyrophosphatase